MKAKAYRRLLPRLRESDPSLEFASWAEAIDYADTGDENTLLTAIFEADQREKDDRWKTVLFAVYWQRLRDIHRRLSWWDPLDPERLWSNITWCFLQTIAGIDLRRRRDRISERIRWGTFHRLYDIYLRHWNRLDREKLVEPGDYEPWATGPDSEMRRQEEQAQRRSAIGRLQRYLSKNLISESDFSLLVATVVGDQPIVEYVERHGFNYERTRKQRSRAVGKLARLKDPLSKKMSRSDRQPPL